MALFRTGLAREDAADDLRSVNRYLMVAIALGVVLVGWHTGWKQAGIPLLWAAACFSCGVVLGFLFGIPKTLQDDHAAPGTDYEQRVNTNLEQISDWLTKILVGLGLTQIGQVWGYLRQAANYIAPALGSGADQSIFVAALLLYFSITGFFGGYLLTRLFLAGAFRRAEGAEVRKKLDRTSADSDISTAVLFMEVFCKDEATRKRNLHYIQQLPARLEEDLKALPLDRPLNIVAARLYEEGLLDHDKSISILREFVKNKTEAKQGSDRDTADAWYNIACSYCAKMKLVAADSAEWKQYRNEALDALTHSIQLVEDNREEAKTDGDLKPLVDTPEGKKLLGLS